jgi:uncharacterized damage-inducible protein DinB
MPQLEQQKSELLAKVRAWPDALRTTRPRDVGWSALQVLDHLVRTESGICGVMARGLAEPARIRMRDRVGFAFVDWVFRSRLRVKMPASVRDVLSPGDAPELSDIEHRWDAARSNLAEIVDCGRECSGGVFRHPVGGWMTLEQVLRFFGAHMVHHGFQLESIKRELTATSRWR